MMENKPQNCFYLKLAIKMVTNFLLFSYYELGGIPFKEKIWQKL